LERGRRILDKSAPGGATRQRFDPQCPAAAVNIKHVEGRETPRLTVTRSKRVEQGLFHAVQHGARVEPPGRDKLAMLVATRDDPHDRDVSGAIGSVATLPNTTRRSHYENAFEHYLAAHGVPLVAVSDVKKSVPGRLGIKAFDYIVYPPNQPPCLIDVKG